MIELMVTIAIAAILAMIAAPSFESFFVRNRIATQSNSLLSALSLARSEAIKRGSRVTVCRTGDATAANPTCSNDASGSWANGWVVFTDDINEAGNVAGQIDKSDQRLRIFEAAQRSTLEAESNINRAVVYLGDGLARGINGSGTETLSTGTFTLCSGTSARSIVINNTGRARVKELSACP